MILPWSILVVESLIIITDIPELWLKPNVYGDVSGKPNNQKLGHARLAATFEAQNLQEHNVQQRAGFVDSDNLVQKGIRFVVLLINDLVPEYVHDFEQTADYFKYLDFYGRCSTLSNTRWLRACFPPKVSKLNKNFMNRKYFSVDKCNIEHRYTSVMYACTVHVYCVYVYERMFAVFSFVMLPDGNSVVMYSCISNLFQQLMSPSISLRYSRLIWFALKIKIEKFFFFLM